jgi:hypothetical protein
MKRAALLLLVAACATTSKLPDAPWTDSELIEVFVQWREAERRRDHDLAAEVLRFDSSADRRFHEAEMEFLRDLEAGPIRTAREIHLAAGPRPRGPGEYLFLEPGTNRYRTSFVAILSVKGEPRIRYRKPDLSEEERATLKQQDLVRTMAWRRLERWKGYQGKELEDEVARLRQMLRYEIDGEEYAREHDLAVAPFAPPPADVLERFEGLDAEAVRAKVVAMLTDAAS